MSAQIKVPALEKDASQIRQKEMIASHFDRLAGAPVTGAKTAYTFVPGNLTELLLSFDVLPVLPEINALQTAVRRVAADYLNAAEDYGYSPDICGYVKADIAMQLRGGDPACPLDPPAQLTHTALHITRQVDRDEQPPLRGRRRRVVEPCHSPPRARWTPMFESESTLPTSRVSSGTRVTATPGA